MDLSGRRLAIHRRPQGNRYTQVDTPDDLSAIPVPLGVGGTPTIDLRALF